MMTTEISTAGEQQLFNGKKTFMWSSITKTESVSGLHQHDYYEFTIVFNRALLSGN